MEAISKGEPMTESATKKATTTTARAAKGTGTAVSADLKEHSGLLEKIRAAAKADDRNVNSWLRRRLVDLDTLNVLFPRVEIKLEEK
jgi:hypothetical protein